MCFFCNFCCNVNFKNSLVVIFVIMLVVVMNIFYIILLNGFGGNCKEFLYMIVINLLNGLKK